MIKTIKKKSFFIVGMKDQWNYILYAPECLIVVLALCVFAGIRKGKRGCIGLIVSAISIFAGLLFFYRGKDWLGKTEPFKPVTINTVISPCQGEILNIKEHGHVTQIIIYLNASNIHVQYAPIDGNIVSIVHKPGEFHPAFMFEKSQYNERIETVINTKAGHIKVVQIAGQIARRVVSFHDTGSILKRGDPLGLIKFGSRVDLWIPSDSIDKILVTKGDRVQIGDPLCICNGSL